MSKPMQAAVIILFVLLVGSAAIAGYFLLQNQKISQENQSLQAQVQEFQNKESELLAKAKKLQSDQQDLNDKIRQKEKERDEAKGEYDSLKSKVDDLNSQIAQANQDRDDYKGRVDTIRKERDDLMDKLKNQKEKIVYKDREPSATEATQTDDTTTADSGEAKSDQYWASVLKEKEALKLDYQKAQSELDQSALQVVELKKQNSDISMQLKNLTDLKDDLEKKLARDKEDLDVQVANEKKEFERKAKYSEDLANSLSLEVARAHSNQKEDAERAEKYKQDSIALQDQIRQLSSTKLALEKTIAQINQDKLSMQKRLDQTEGAIQGRIDEIWKIKQNLDQKISQLPTSLPSSNDATSAPTKQTSAEVELSPIVVNPTANAPMAEETPRATKNSKADRKRATAVNQAANNTVSKNQGTIISINEPNNFVIVDMGENDGSEIGRHLTVIRENQPVGSLEVIQVRKDISAADIKESNGALRVGDMVWYN